MLPCLPELSGFCTAGSETLAVLTGGVLFCFALHPEVGGGCLGGQRAGQPVQQAQEAGRPLPQQCSGSDPSYVDGGVAAPVSAGSQQPEHAAHLLPIERQRQNFQGHAKLHQVHFNSRMQSMG